MSGLPEGEKLLAFGGYYSPENPNPDGSDYTFIRDCADDELIQGWDWTQELIYSAGWIDLPIPGKTYYFKGVVRTNKAVYYSNTVTINTDGLPGYTPGPQDRVLPVVFHVMPRKDGTYPHPYFFDEMLACADPLPQLFVGYIEVQFVTLVKIVYPAAAHGVEIVLVRRYAVEMVAVQQ